MIYGFNFNGQVVWNYSGYIKLGDSFSSWYNHFFLPNFPCPKGQAKIQDSYNFDPVLRLITRDEVESQNKKGNWDGFEILGGNESLERKSQAISGEGWSSTPKVIFKILMV